MRAQLGAHRKLTDEQVEKIMAHCASRAHFLANHGSMHELAAGLGVSVEIIRHCIQRRAEYLHRPKIVAVLTGLPSTLSLRRRSPGNPGKLTDAERAIVLTWHAAYIQSGFERGSIKRLAREFGVAERTIYNCIKRKGIYKKAYGERKLTASGQHCESPRPERPRKLSRRDRQAQLLNSAMRAWK